MVVTRLQRLLAGLLAVTVLVFLAGWGINMRKLPVWERSVSPKEPTTTTPTPPAPDGSNGVRGFATVATPPPSPRPIKILGSIPYWDQERAVKTYLEHASALHFISLFWFYLSKDGSIAKYTHAKENRQIIDDAHARGTKVFLLIANLPEETGTDWDWRRVERAIGTPRARAEHIRRILALVEKQGVDGANIDYENLRDAQTTSFSAFITELGSALHKRKRLLRVTIHPRQDNSDETHGQDWKTIARAADQLAFMTYDEHWQEGNAGPIASVGWARRTLEFALAQGVPREKIFLGVPLYGYDWPRVKGGGYKKARGLEYEDVTKLPKTLKVSPGYDALAASPHFSYTRDGVSHVVWFENSRSFEAKLRLAQEFGIGGVSLWRLGREDQKIWTTAQKFIPRSPPATAN